jgi:hypothetical protein
VRLVLDLGSRRHLPRRAPVLPYLFGQLLPAFMAHAVVSLWNIAVFLDAWAKSSGPWLWIYLGLSFAAVAGIPRLLRTRPGTIPAVAATIGGFIRAGVVAPWISPQQKFAALDLPSLRPFVAAGDLRTQEMSLTSMSGRTSFQTSVEARITTEGKADGMFVRWIPYQAGQGEFPSWNMGVLRSPASKAALNAVLPAPVAEPTLSSEEIESIPIRDEHASAVTVAGIVFHYEILADLPLLETPSSSTKEDVTAVAQLHVNPPFAAVPKLMLRYTSLDYGRMRFEHRRFPDRISPFHDSFTLALYLPKQKVCIALEGQNRGQFTPIPGGGTGVRFELTPIDEKRLDLSSWTGARIIVLRPVIDGTLKRRLELPPIPPSDSQRESVRMDQGTRITEADYLNRIRPNRPDPATCTEDEFDRYLQAVRPLWPGFILKDDLAEYAPRFPQVLARYLSSKTVADAIGDSVPESAKAEIISAIQSPQDALNAAGMLTHRGWQVEARDPLLECLAGPFLAQRGGEVYPVIVALAELEDPSTYPALVRAYENRGMYYELIRPLPGIKPQLDEAVERMSGKLKISLLEFTSFSSAISGALETYEAPVSHGNPTALAKLLEFWENLPFESIGELDETPPPGENKGDRDMKPEFLVMASGDADGSAPNMVLKDFTRFFRIDPPIPHKLAAWRAFVAGKNAADFSYDPLARRWRASSLTK